MRILMQEKSVFLICLIIGIIITSRCATYIPVAPQISGSSILQIPPPPAEKKLVAIAGFENKSTYAADKLWDTSAQMLMTELLYTSYFRVVEWAEMKRLFDWEALSTCSLLKNPTEMKKAQGILNCEYFLSGAVTRFDVQVKSNVSALSKKKSFQTNIRIDIMLQNASTGEYLSQGIGKAIALQTLKGDITGGQTGTWDPASANDALERAIRSALSQLIVNFDRQKRRPRWQEGF